MFRTQPPLQGLLLSILLASGAAWAADTPQPQAVTAKPEAAAKASAPDADMAEGEVRKVDKDAKKITLKHGQIRSIDMPAMTMVFQVSDAALLDKVKAGDKVRFKAAKAGAGYAVTQIEVQK